MPNPGDRLLDTSIVVDYLRGSSGLKQRLLAVPTLLLSSTVLGELYLGAEMSANSALNLKLVDEFASTCSILACDQQSAREYGKLKLALRLAGRMIPDNDVWIAAVAVQHELTLATR